MKVISEYMGDSGERKAKVYLDEEHKKYIVIYKDVFGVSYRNEFSKLQSAEESAEDYVL